jgi:hypothetical protein
MRALVWLAGCVGFLYAIDRLDYWREAAALAVLVAAFCWIVGGGFWAMHLVSRRDAPRVRAAADTATLTPRQAPPPEQSPNLYLTAEEAEAIWRMRAEGNARRREGVR